MRHLPTIFTIFLWSLTCLSGSDLSSKFKNNEVLTYVVKWTGIPAGEIVMSSRIFKIDDNQFIDMSLSAKTNGMLSMVYKVHETIKSRASGNVFKSLTFKKESKQGRRHYKENFNFAYNEAVISYEKNNLAKKSSPEKREYKIKDGVKQIFDPLSVLYYLRTIKFSKDNPISPMMSVFADKKGVYEVQYKLKKITHITSAAYGRRKVYNIEPTAEFKGTIVNSGKLELWVDVETGVLLRIKMSIPIGYASLELRSAKGSDLKHTSFRHRRTK